MWMSVDRIEGDIVVLIDEAEKIYHLTTSAYFAMVGQSPKESHVLSCQIKDDNIISAVYSPEETQYRLAMAKARLERLRQRAKKK